MTICTNDASLFGQMLQVIAEHLSVEEVEVIRDMFTLMDSDNDGKVTYEELRAGLRKVGSQLAEPEIKLLMDVVNLSRTNFTSCIVMFYFAKFEITPAPCLLNDLYRFWST